MNLKQKAGSLKLFSKMHAAVRSMRVSRQQVKIDRAKVALGDK